MLDKLLDIFGKRFNDIRAEVCRINSTHNNQLNKLNGQNHGRKPAVNFTETIKSNRENFKTKRIKLMNQDV